MWLLKFLPTGKTYNCASRSEAIKLEWGLRARQPHTKAEDYEIIKVSGN